MKCIKDMHRVAFYEENTEELDVTIGDEIYKDRMNTNL